MAGRRGPGRWCWGASGPLCIASNGRLPRPPALFRNDPGPPRRVFGGAWKPVAGRLFAYEARVEPTPGSSTWHRVNLATALPVKAGLRCSSRGNGLHDKGLVFESNLGRAPFVEPTGIETPAGERQIRVNHDTDRNTYRCFLPDLTGFASVCCMVSNRRSPF